MSFRPKMRLGLRGPNPLPSFVARVCLSLLLCLVIGCGSGSGGEESNAETETSSAEAGTAGSTELASTGTESTPSAAEKNGNQPVSGQADARIGIPNRPTVGAPSSNGQARPLMIGSFNIARFGEKKSANTVVMQQLMELVHPYDVVAIQEIVSQKEAVIENFVAKLNEKYGAKFNYVMGPFVGRTTYVERLAFVYDTSRVKLVEQPFVVADPEDKLHREPLVARFQVREELSRQPFSFVLVNLHLDPKEGQAELDYCSDIVNQLESLFGTQEDDILLLGDFNLSPGKMFSATKFAARPEWKSMLDDRVMTNTRQDKAYDNILFHRQKTGEFLQRQGAIDLRARFRISLEEALEISDHLPIWGAFSLDEAGARVAAESGETVR